MSQAVASPDGKRVAFVSPGTEEIAAHTPIQVFVMDADGSKVRMLTRSQHSKFEPCWSPDGTAIVFAAEKMGVKANVFHVDLDSGAVRRLTAGRKFDSRPAYSPDGSKLAFCSNLDGNSEIYVMSLR